MPAEVMIEKSPPETPQPDLVTGGPGIPGLPPETPPESPRPEGVTPVSEAPPTPTPPALPGPTYRFKSQEDAEKAETEAKQRMHQATNEAATLRKKLAEVEAARDTRSTEEYLESATREMHRELRANPDNDPELAQKEAAIMLKHNAKIAQRIAEGVVSKQQAAAQQAGEDRVQQVRQGEATEKLITDRLATEGLTRPSHRRLFDAVLAGVRETTPGFVSLTTEEQFGLVLTPMYDMLGMTTEQLQALAKKNDEARRNATVLRSGGKGPAPSGAPEKPKTMGELMDDVRADQAKRARA